MTIAITVVALGLLTAITFRQFKRCVTALGEVEAMQYRFLDNLNNGKPAGRDWFIGYELLDSGEQVSTVLHAYSKMDSLQRFNDNFWQIAYGDPQGGPSGVDAKKVYEIIEVRPATAMDRRPDR